MTRNTAERLKPYLTELLHQKQYCGVQGKTVFEGVATIRYVIAHTEMTGKPLCVVSIDFSEAFGNISHEYLQKVLQAHAFSEPFIRRIMLFLRQSDIRDTNQRQIPIKISVRQGCPLSMTLYAMCLNPLIRQ